jgi:hypothetical protein
MSQRRGKPATSPLTNNRGHDRRGKTLAAMHAIIARAR